MGMKRYLFSFVLLLTLLSGCVKEPVRSRDDGPYTVRMTLLGSVQPFDAPEGTKAAPALTWTEGERIYVRASDGHGEAKGVAVCQADGTWTLRYDAPMDSRTLQAECWYFPEAGYTRFEVPLSYSSVVYEDAAATLTFDGEGNVTLSTYLKPKTGRLRFRNADGGNSNISLSGLSWYSSFDLSTFSFTTASHNITSFYVADDNYFYGFFADESRKLVVKNDILYFGREFGESVLRSGSSGYLTVPTNDAYDGWTVENPENLDAYVPIEFEDRNFKEWLRNNGYDLDYDGEITHLEGRAVTSIQNDRDESVVSLGGIEWFPNLERLIWTGYETWDNDYERHGRLVKVDVSQNPKLRELNLRCNKLSSLDLSNNPELRSLTIWGNLFETIDLSGCPNLDYLDAGDNKLTALDLSVVPELTGIYCYTNQLTSLDVSRNTKLRILNLGTNKVTSINVSGLDRLEEFWCYDNPLGTLNLSGLSALRNLNCNGAQLSSLDLSQSPHLNYLECRGNQLTSLNLSGLAELETLYCSDNQLTALNVDACLNLRSLDLTNNQILVLDVSMLSQLDYMMCFGNQITSLVLGSNGNLRTMGCENNMLTSLDLSGLGALEYLYCSNNQLTSLDPSACRNLRALHADSNHLSSINVSGLLKLEELSFSINSVATIDLSSCTNLIYLGAGSNQLTSLDVSALSRLETLYCDTNKLTTLDVSQNHALRYLGCWDNLFTTLDLTSNVLLEGLSMGTNPYLTTVYVKAGLTFPNGLYYDEQTEIVYVD